MFERLPEELEDVLVWYEYRIMDGTYEGEMNQTYGIGYVIKGNWFGDVSGVDSKCLYWMPLPESPNEL